MISGKVLGCKLDQNSNILVSTEYTLTDGSKTIGHTRYNFLNFSKEKVLKDVKIHCETLLRRVYSLKAHQALVRIDLSDIKHQCLNLRIVVKAAVRDEQGNITTPAVTKVIDDK